MHRIGNHYGKQCEQCIRHVMIADEWQLSACSGGLPEDDQLALFAIEPRCGIASLEGDGVRVAAKRTSRA